MSRVTMTATVVATVGMAAMIAAGAAGQPQPQRTEPVDLVCRKGDKGADRCMAAPDFLDNLATSAAQLGKKSYHLPPLGEVTPTGWLLNQLTLQANALSGYMATSTFPGALDVNQSLWVGGDYKTGTLQWLPYWTNGNVPLVELIKAAGAEDKLEPGANLVNVVDGYVKYILAHTNKSSGWIGPFANEPGDINGHGLWDPLNMLRTLLNYGQSHPDMADEIAKACVAHMTKEAEMLKTDPVYKWAQTRWPTYVEIALYIVDELVPVHGANPKIMPLGGDGTTAMLLNSSALFAQKGMNWNAYYHRTGSIKFPFGPVPNWNTNDHGVNNAEGALRYPAAAYRLQNNQSFHAEMDYVLGMLDRWQGQVNAMFCADEVFCGREPHRGTETCAVVEAMASLEYAFTTLGDPLLMDRVERLAFNAMPAALTADMWTHVYVQQANSVFAGNTQPTDNIDNVATETGLDAGGCARCGGYSDSPDTPSGEDMGSNFFGVSHFPCCITNFPQGWPKFAMHTIVAETDHSGLVVASLVPSKASLKAVGANVVVDSAYPFGDTATITVTTTKAITAKVRIPGWATKAVVDGKPARNGTLVAVACPAGQKTTIAVALHMEPRIEVGWGGYAEPSQPSINYSAAVTPVPTGSANLAMKGGCAWEGQASHGTDKSLRGIRSGNPKSDSTAVITSPLAGDGHYIDSVTMEFQYIAGYTPTTPGGKKATTVELAAYDFLTGAKLASVYQSGPLGNYSYDKFTSYSPPIRVAVSGLKILNARPVQLRLNFVNNDRNLELVFKGDLGVKVGWTPAQSPDPVVPVPAFQRAADNAASVVYGPLLFALHPKENMVVKTNYLNDLPARPKAVDYEISTAETWNYAIDLSVPPTVNARPSKGWSDSLPFSTTEYPLSITVTARQVPGWGFWHGSQITDSPPPSPLDCAKAGCGAATSIQLVPFGGTNIRISAFPWFASNTV